MTEGAVGEGSIDEAAAALRAEARRTDERRLLVVVGERAGTAAAAGRALEGAGLSPAEVTLVGERDRQWAADCVAPSRADALLGTSRDALVLDGHDTCRPNALGQVVGSVTGGGLLVYLAPSAAAWTADSCGFHRSLAVPPFDTGDVSTRFHERLLEFARVHPGVAVYQTGDGEGTAPGDGTLVADGLTDPAPRLVDSRERSADTAPGGAESADDPAPPDEPSFPTAAYDACLTGDQAAAVDALAALRSPAVGVIEADRGRGKSSAAGIAAACLAAAGDGVLVTGPSPAAVEALFDRAAALLATLDQASASAAADAAGAGTAGAPDPATARLETAAGGWIAFERPPAAADRVDPEGRDASACRSEPADVPDVLVVDEAAALPVRLLERFLAADRVAYVTTVHGYEGAGRGFDVRFRGSLTELERPVVEATLAEPIRYAAGDPVEVWAFRTLALSAGPPADQLVADARPATTETRAIGPGELLADEPLLREVFGQLVLAHYRTEPNDLARLLDAPNVSVRARLHEGHVASVALLAREGALDPATRAGMYEGERVAGNMLPDVLTSQLRDEAAGIPAGGRVLRIATHAAARGRGLGSALLADLAAAHREELSYLGVGFGATPGLLEFWAASGYGAVHLSTRRNDRSGEHSAIMLRPLDGAGAALLERHATAFADRAPAILADALDGVDPDVVRAVLGAVPVERTPTLDDRDWRLVVGAAFGPALYDVDPGPFRELAVCHLLGGDSPGDGGAGVRTGTGSGPGGVPDGAPGGLLDADAERLLVAKVLQARPWDAVADRLGYVSRAECMRALGRAYRPLVERYGGPVARRERARYAGDGGD